MWIVIISVWMMSGLASTEAIERIVTRDPWQSAKLTQTEQMVITLLWPLAWALVIWLTIEQNKEKRENEKRT